MTVTPPRCLRPSKTANQAWDELQLIPASNWQQQLIAGQRFNHAKCSIDATYNRADAMKLFYSDVTSLLPHSRDEFDRIGRSTMANLIDPLEPLSQARLEALRNDTIWNAMNSVGNRSAFRTIAGLSALHDAELELIGADWMDIRWWADSMLKVAPKLTRILQLASILRPIRNSLRLVKICSRFCLLSPRIRGQALRRVGAFW